VDAELREKTETGAGERAAAEDHLAFTGAHAPQFLGVGSGLLAAGIVLLLATRRQRARA
jgi:hypothetical protein